MELRVLRGDPWSPLDRYTINVYIRSMKDEVSLPDFEGFDWGGGNAEKNWKAHQVSPLESEQVFFNRPLLCAPDQPHSRAETRYFVLGQTDEGRELFIAFTLRGKRIRVISAREMSRRERRVYRS